MKLRMRVLAGVLLIPSVLSGCVLYSKTNLVIKVPDFYDSKAEKDRLFLIADPFITPGKIEYLCDIDLTHKGIYTVHLILQNHGMNEFDFSASEVFLVREDGESFAQMSPEEVTENVLRNTVGRTLGFGAVGSLGLLFMAVPFAVGGGMDSYLSNKNIREDMEDRFRRDAGRMAGKEILQGFLFFRVAGNKKAAAEAFGRDYSLKIENLRNVTTGESFGVDIPIKKPAAGY